ncbi:hypothetical protein [Kitasatospora fiedleri]|uniref:hypothetical protein n=1 Tax=Kitasatospora fiedleri TaxID=2991545 RepID=UPI00249C5D60|nr:hypothetical protein [Kitasatospora fiedleri]
MNTIALTVNGAPRTLPAATTLDVVVAEVSAANTGVAAAVNEAVVPAVRGPPRRSARATGSRSSPPSREAEPWRTTRWSSPAPPSPPA